MLRKGQMRLLKSAKDRLGISDESFFELLVMHGGARKVEELTPEGFFGLMEQFRKMGFSKGPERPAGPEKAGGGFIEMVTPSQRAKIRQLEEKLGWSDNPALLEGFILKNFRLDRVFTKEQASRVIDALKAMLGQEQGPTSSASR